MSGLLRATAEALHSLPPELTVFIISALPVFEIRGGAVAGLALYNMPLSEVLLFGFLGNIASVTPILLFLEPLSRWLYGNPIADRFFGWLFRRAQRKADQVNRWGALGLLVLVAIPLPGTGAWTGSVVAVFLRMRRRRAIPATYLGIIIAGLIVSAVTLTGIAGMNRIAR